MFLAITAFVAQVTAPPPPPLLVSPAPTPSASASPLPQTSAPVPVETATPAPFTVVPASIALSPAQQQTLALSGAAAPLAVTSDRKLVQVTVNQTTLAVTVTATQATGTDVLHIADARGANVDVPVRVAFPAGTVVKTTTLKVTGSPLDPAWLASQVSSLVARLTQALPGAQVTIAAVSPPPVVPAPGQQAQFTVPVQIAGGDAYYDVNDATTVNVQNVAVNSFLPSLLFYDDDPEHITADGVLYRGTVDAARPVRLYYYHDNGPEPRRIVLMLGAQSQDPTSVQVIDSSAGPNIDVMGVGHATSKNFLLLKPQNEGTVVDLGSDPATLHDIPMQNRQGVAGTVGLRVLSGGAVTVTVLAASPGIDPRTLINGPVLPDDGHHRSGVFTLTNYGTAELPYTVGGADAKVVYGDREPTPPNADPAAPGHDYGDYGVLWNLNFTLTNPTAAPATVYLYERPIGGVLRSSFLVGTNLVDMGCVRVSTPYQIGAYDLAPGQTYRLPVQTMTDGGSNYPIEVGITQTPPQPTPPPISSADGCFPKPQATLSPAPSPVPTQRSQ
ncbi:MAG TPA: hypothetical protein VGN11_04935 [Candidatus Baltobacteraceae bacterium]|jgi:hypothetical protein|nr:hypothetical protein [Candidatus Baltobacteraceae bacterium]